MCINSRGRRQTGQMECFLEAVMQYLFYTFCGERMRHLLWWPAPSAAPDFTPCWRSFTPGRPKSRLLGIIPHSTHKCTGCMLFECLVCLSMNWFLVQRELHLRWKTPGMDWRIRVAPRARLERGSGMDLCRYGWMRGTNIKKKT